ncbi:exonuclease 3'-5' domain-containing protein 2 isoform X2 [Nymphalis io]|uniref:exonuclease 3'-5' domain-containing protein 2 isoform X2 n=1 Tax=Inachis io TaxID=171585 RepID=UPI00216A05C3|nr:exonuclease 3'-5' domain-containing protein 2 isoform X2 [Nymphalis io]
MKFSANIILLFKMNTPSKFQLGLTSAIALGFAGITYLVLKQALKLKNPSRTIDYLVIKTITSEESCEEIVQELRRRCTQHHAIGFDCEWVSEQRIRHPVALLQLSTYDGYCALFRLSHMKSIPKPLKELLEDKSIYKVGVAPGDDAMYLAMDYSVYMKSTLDIRHIVELCRHNTGGLAFLAKMFLGVVLDKNRRIRCSNWGADELTERQIKYAALDAHVAIRIFVKVVNDYHKSPYLLLWNRYNNDHWNKIHQICSKYSDKCYRNKQIVKKKATEYKEKNTKATKEVFNKKYSNSTRSKPLYHNCFLQAPDGEILCTCDNKKAVWYVEKELADIVSEDPLTVRLRFEPAGRSVGDVGRYYQLTKENKCVVCGVKDSYIRKNVVPREYRKYFPEIMKDHSSHDVVLLCVECHQTSNMRDQPVRESLARRCSAPLAAHDAGKFLEDKDSKKIRSAARALLYQSKKHVLPEARRKELESIILQYYIQHDEITQDLLQEAALLQVTKLWKN